MKFTKQSSTQNSLSAFTLIELLVVIAIIGILSSVVLAAISSARESARDTRRLQDMRQIQTALEMYYNDNGEYPDEDGSGWEYSTEDNEQFLDILVSDGYLSNYIIDPVNGNGYRYRYYRYPDNYGCEDGYYVLGVDNMESVNGNHPDSPGWSCPDRDWQSNGDWITGQFQ